MARTPKLGGELPTYNTMTPKKPRKPAPRIMSISPTNPSKFVQRSPKVSMGTPGTSKFVQRTPGGAHQRKPGMAGAGKVMGTIRAILNAPRKPAK